MEYIKKDRLILTIFLLALVIRLFFVMPSKGMLSGDAAGYDMFGLSLAKGEGYINTNGTPCVYFPPFYPFFLSVIYKFLGHSYLAVKAIQSVIGAFTCVLIYLIAKRICSIKVGLYSALISVVYPPFIKSAELLITEAFITFILALIVFYLLKIQEGAGFDKCVILGLLLGVSLLTKPMILLFPFFIIPIFIYSNKNNFYEIIKKYSIVLLFFGLTALPWVIRNYVVHHKFLLVSTHGGITLYSSYCPPNGIFGMNATIDDPVVMEASKISSPIQASDFLTKKAISYILNNPGKVLRLEFKKVLYFWAPFDWEIIGNRWFNFIYAALLPFSAAGILFAVRRFKKFYPILALIIYFQIMTLIFYGSPRFRLVIEPYLFILAVIGAIIITRYMSGKKGSKYDDICSDPGF